MPAETQICQNCQNCKTEFMIEPEDFVFYEKINVPPPTFCPECRYQRRLTNRNEWNFYKRKCDLCVKDIVSIYKPEYPGPIYCQPCWWGDGWDPFEYGQDFDFSRPFFEQFHEFRLKIPHVAMAIWNSVNSEYTNQALNNRNCYMCVTATDSENCLYCHALNKVRESMDSYGMLQSEFVYESLNSTNCSNSAYLEDCADSTASYFLKNCRGCLSCFGSYGLRNKSYCWKNEQLSKEEYQKRFSEFVFTRTNITQERKALADLSLRYPHRNFQGYNAANSTGDYLRNVKNLSVVFQANDSENLRYCQDAPFSQDSMDATEVWSELCYEVEGISAKSSIAITKSIEVFDAYYSELCSNSHDLFGCVGLKKTEYGIFNRRYTKEEYQYLSQKIIVHMKQTGEWGEFFPATLTLFDYNETVAQDYFPLTEQKAKEKGLQWHHRTERGYTASLSWAALPETITETDDSILQQVISCSSQENSAAKEKYLNCATAFRVLPQELELYRKMNIPIPEKCPSCRRQDRMELRNPRKLWKRRCQCVGNHSENGVYPNQSEHFHADDSCPNEFETSYAPDRPEIVYCEQCYQAEVV